MFHFRLALQLGFSHPDELLSRLTASQLAGWRAYNEIEPVDHQYRAELRSGSQMALMANLKRNPETKPDPWRALDFMHYVEHLEEEPERELTDEELEAYAAQVFGA